MAGWSDFLAQLFGPSTAPPQSSYGYRSPTPQELTANPFWNDLLMAQKSLKSTDATQGELGLLIHPDNTTISHEISVGIPNPFGGGEVNVPALVHGQSPDAILRFLFGKPLAKDYKVASDRARQRVLNGASLPIYLNPEAATAAAVARENVYQGKGSKK